MFDQRGKENKGTEASYPLADVGPRAGSRM